MDTSPTRRTASYMTVPYGELTAMLDYLCRIAFVPQLPNFVYLLQIISQLMCHFTVSFFCILSPN